MSITLDNGSGGAPKEWPKGDGQGGDPDRQGGESFPPLNVWSYDESQLSRSAALKAGFPVSESSTGLETRVIVRELRTYWEAPVKRTTEQWGVSIRLVVTVSDTDLDTQLSLPAIAAKVQIEGLVATANLVVRGFAHSDLGKLFPNFSDLNVETYARYTQAMDDIRQFIAQHPEGISPLRLAVVEDHEADDRVNRTMIATALALESISRGIPYDQALVDIENGPQFAETLKSVWVRFDPALIPSEKPADEARERARRILAGAYSA